MKFSPALKIAREAAALLYFGAEKEYKQAKLKAAKNLGFHDLPTNLQVAIELDKLAEEIEGSSRKKRVVGLRAQALNIMKIMENYEPILIGSVWRGTIRKESDIDIAVYTDEPENILRIFRRLGFNVSKTEWVTVTKKGRPVSSFHIHLLIGVGQKVEVVARNLDEKSGKRKCEIFGDELKGLNIFELERVLRENPAEKFIPFC